MSKIPGFACPECGGRTTVYNCRQVGDNFKRFRKCLTCGCRFVTYEKYIEDASHHRNDWQTKWDLKP